MNQPLYTRDVLRLAVSIPHEGRLKEPHGSAEIHSKTCGSRVVADVRMSNRQEVVALGVEVNACALGQASTAIVAREAIGKSVEDIRTARDQMRGFLEGALDSPGQWQDIDLLETAREYPGRHAAILLPYDAIIAAMADAVNPDRVS